MDAAEANGNGITCSDGMTADDPRCTEQFENSALATLKVTTVPGYGFNGWTVDGAESKTASAEPLLLTSMPTLASATVQIPDGTEGTVEIDCPKEVNVLFSFDDGPHSAEPSGDNYTIEVLDELAENAAQKNAKAMWCIQTHVPPSWRKFRWTRRDTRTMESRTCRGDSYWKRRRSCRS